MTVLLLYYENKRFLSKNGIEVSESSPVNILSFSSENVKSMWNIKNINKKNLDYIYHINPTPKYLRLTKTYNLIWLDLKCRIISKCILYQIIKSSIEYNYEWILDLSKVRINTNLF